MDEIDYFPKRDKYKIRKDVGSDWNKLKKQKTTRPTATKHRKTPFKEEDKTIK